MKKNISVTTKRIAKIEFTEDEVRSALIAQFGLGDTIEPNSRVELSLDTDGAILVIETTSSE